MEPEPRRVSPDRLPERVYWFRRALVLVGLALVIALIVWLSSLPGTPRSGTTVKPPLAPSSSTAPSALDSTQATALPGPLTPAVPTTSASPTPPAAAPASPAAAECDPGILTLSISGPGAVKVGATGQFTVTVTNSGLAACTFTFDSRFTFTIVSGTDQIWSTADCTAWAPTGGSQELAIGASATWQTTWDRHRSQAGCKVVPTPLGPGTYVANAQYSGAPTAQRVVLLTA
jgi:hypothetical protein